MAVLFNTVIVNVDETLVLLVAVLAVIGYLFHLFFYIFFSRRRAAKRYKIGREALERRIASIKKLEEIYVEEEENRSPTISMEDMEDLI